MKVDTEPQLPEVRHDETLRPGAVDNDGGIAAMTASQARQRAVSGRFVFDDNLNDEIASELEAGSLDRVGDQEDLDHPGLVVPRAAAKQTIAFDVAA